jgi:hypothetical protein
MAQSTPFDANHDNDQNQLDRLARLRQEIASLVNRELSEVELALSLIQLARTLRDQEDYPRAIQLEEEAQLLLKAAKDEIQQAAQDVEEESKLLAQHEASLALILRTAPQQSLIPLVGVVTTLTNAVEQLDTNDLAQVVGGDPERAEHLRQETTTLGEEIQQRLSQPVPSMNAARRLVHLLEQFTQVIFRIASAVRTIWDLYQQYEPALRSFHF